MARSTYIYTVHYLGTLMGAYTVKHEMITEVGRRLRELNEMPPGAPVIVTRHRDGYATGQQDVTDQFAWFS